MLALRHSFHNKIYLNTALCQMNQSSTFALSTVGRIQELFVEELQMRFKSPSTVRP